MKNEIFEKISKKLKKKREERDEEKWCDETTHGGVR